MNCGMRISSGNLFPEILNPHSAIRNWISSGLSQTGKH